MFPVDPKQTLLYYLMYNLGMARGEEKGWHRDRPIDVDVQNRWLMYD